MRQPDEDRRVLIVDDDQGMLATLRDILDASGYQVQAAGSGAEAIESVREGSPDCVLMDMRMPGMHGVDTFRQIKRLAPASPVIFMTAYAASELVEDAWREGAVEVMLKPLDLERVLQVLEQTMTTHAVLVVDDDDDFGRVLSEALETQEFDVRVAHAARDAITIFEREPRRTVVLDMKLGEDSGLDLLPAIKELNPGAAVILMSGFPGLQEEMRKGLDMNATACLAKPFEIDDLVRAIRSAAGRRDQQNESEGEPDEPRPPDEE